MGLKQLMVVSLGLVALSSAAYDSINKVWVQTRSFS